MAELGANRVHPALKELVVEASRALSRLDAERLEELAVSCQALNRDLGLQDAAGGAALATESPSLLLRHSTLATEARDAAGEMAIFGRVLEATRANLIVMRRLRELHQARLGQLARTQLEYGNERQEARSAFAAGAWLEAPKGSRHGDN